MKKAIVIGASSGIGKELAKILSKDGYIVGITARNTKLLEEIKNEHSNISYIRTMDIAKTDEAMKILHELIQEMDGVDLIIISAGIGHINKDLNWELEKTTIDTNVYGVTAIINTIMHHFIKQGKGHLVAISSIVALYGIDGNSPAYAATKAYLSNYLQGLRSKVRSQKLNIHITDIKPGFVDTVMAQGEGLFWVMPVDVACNQMYKAIKKKKKDVVVTKRWKLIAFYLKGKR